MRVKIEYTVEVDESLRDDIFFHYTGGEGLADEEMVRKWFMRNADGWIVEVPK